MNDKEKIEKAMKFIMSLPDFEDNEIERYLVELEDILNEKTEEKTCTWEKHDQEYYNVECKVYRVKVAYHIGEYCPMCGGKIILK